MASTSPSVAFRWRHLRGLEAPVDLSKHAIAVATVTAKVAEATIITAQLTICMYFSCNYIKIPNLNMRRNHIVGKHSVFSAIVMIFY